jgi:mycothiol synthase
MRAGLSELVLAPAETDADLEDLIAVRRRVHPRARPTVENLRFNLARTPGLAYLVARLAEQPAACGFIEPWSTIAHGDIAVVPELRRRGIGSAMLAELSRRIQAFGQRELQMQVGEADTESYGFLERRGFVQVGAEKAVELELDSAAASSPEPPPGIRIVSRADEPEHLDGMYQVAVQADEDIPGSDVRRTFEEWRAQEIDKPSRRPELCFVALAGKEVVGYAALQVFGDEAHHGLTAVRRDWRRRGVGTALKRAEIAAAKEAGFRRLATESEERNEPMRRLNEKLGFVPSPELSVVMMRGTVV